MWNIFKILNLFTILLSAYAWFTTSIPVVTLMLIMNAAMIICMIQLPTQFRLDNYTGRILLAFSLLVIWTIFDESVGMGLGLALQYMPVFYLIALPREYQCDLLKFVTKWLAILLIPSLIVFWLSFFINIPKFGTFVMQGYDPFNNYIFYIETTNDYGFFQKRFNSFFPEPGHMSMVCVFLMMANRFDFKKNPWMWVILTAVGFSFSLAGYILTLIGYLFIKINSIAKGLAMGVLIAVAVVGIMNYAGGDNAINQLIIERLKYDENKGIQGNNRFFNNTDFEYSKALKSGDYLTGVSQKANMKLISGAGFKIYILQHGLIGMLIVLALYLCLIPPQPDWHFSLAFLFLVVLCFMQNAYPSWYAWLLPYVLSLNIYAHEE